MKLDSFETLLKDHIKDLYNAETQIVQALPKVAQAVSNPELKEALEIHLEETRNQVKRLEQVGKILGTELKGKKCKGMEGLIAEAKELLEEEGEPAVIDAGIIAACQKVEHYEICAYGTASAWAEQLGLDEVVALLDETLEEESNADEKLSQIAEEDVNLEAEEADDEEDEEEEDDEESSSGARR